MTETDEPDEPKDDKPRRAVLVGSTIGTIGLAMAMGELLTQAGEPYTMAEPESFHYDLGPAPFVSSGGRRDRVREKFNPYSAQQKAKRKARKKNRK